MGKCPDCGEWDGLEKYVEPASTPAAAPTALAEAWTTDDVAGGPVAAVARAVPLNEIEMAQVGRISSGIGELDRVLGGGFVPGSVVLLGGDPGIGKSTLLLQAAAHVSRGGAGGTGAEPGRVLYASSEESGSQTRLRAERLLGDDAEALGRLADLYILADTNLDRVVEQARQVRPRLLIVDSVQMVYKADVDAAPGSVTQLRRCCMELVNLAKISGMVVVLIGHVTKDGQLSGPKLLEHLVDVVLSFEGDRHHAHRVVRGIKNRFGTTLEVGLFEMTGSGLAEITDVGRMIRPDVAPRPGSVLCPLLHGSRCLMVEVQALTATGFLGSAKRKTSGVDSSRLAMLIAVLEQHAGLRLADQDVFVSAVGGLKVVEPAADLALCLAIAGAHLRRRMPAGIAMAGEVGLGGEVRPAGRVEARLHEAARLGYRRTIMSDGLAGDESGGAIIGVGSVADAIEILEPADSGPAMVETRVGGRIAPGVSTP